MSDETQTTITVGNRQFTGKVRHEELSADDGGGWIVGYVDVHQAFALYEGRRVCVTIEVLDE